MKNKLLAMVLVGSMIVGLTACGDNSVSPASSNNAQKDKGDKLAIVVEEPTTEELATEEPAVEAGPDLTGYDNIGSVYFLPGEFYYSESQEITGVGTQQVYILNGETLETFGALATTPSELAVSSGLMADTESGTIRDLLRQSMVSGYGEDYISSEFTGGQNRAGAEMLWSVYEYDNVEISGITVTVRWYVYVDDTDAVLFMHITPDVSEFSGKFEDILRSIIVYNDAAAGSSGDASGSSSDTYLEDYDGTKIGIKDIPGYTKDYESESYIEFVSQDGNISIVYSFEYGTPQDISDYRISFYEDEMEYTLSKKETGAFTNDLGQEYQYLLLDIDTGYSVRHELFFFSAVDDNNTFSVEIVDYGNSINIDDYKYLVNSDIVSR